ncbi:MAG: DUF1553 domain-containing protein [Pseudomonadales bacterium]
MHVPIFMHPSFRFLHVPTLALQRSKALSILRQSGRIAILFCELLVLSGQQSVAEVISDDSDGLAAEITFNQDVRPILSNKCYTCHGPDSNTREADIRLDSREEAIASGAIVPGEPGSSLVIERITSSDPDVVMPPTESQKKLTASEKSVLRDWIAQGAKYQKHWSFESLTVDEAANRSIDDYIDVKLHEKNLRPSPPATRERWLRRVTLDLNGLPPKVEDIDAFLADQTPKAFEKVVDRLLSSPAFGERMAADWLDVARYSDTFGYQVDRDRYVWPWRDWVIRAFNNNLPYDDFVTHQLAGDLLPNATDEQILATTFNRLHPQKVEGGSVEEEFRVEYVVDRAQTVSTAFMGLTFECARCHDHKFDPLTQKEFYELNAFFASINEAGLYSYHTQSTPTPTLRLPTDAQREELARADLAVAQADRELAQALEIAHEQKLSSLEVSEEIAGPIAAQNFDALNEAKNLPVELIDGVIKKAASLSGDSGVEVSPADFRRWQPFSVALWMQTPDVKERAVVFHCSLGWTDAASRGYQLLIEEGKLSAGLIHFWPGNAINVRTLVQIPPGEWLHVTMTYDGSSRADGLKLFVNGRLAEYEVTQDSLTKEIQAGKNRPVVIGQRERDRGFTHGLVDEFEVYNRRLTAAEVQTKYEQKPLSDLLNQEALANLAPHVAREFLVEYADVKSKKARAALQVARKQRDELLDQIEEIMVMRELTTSRETYVLDRGVYDARQSLVHPNTSAALPPMPANAPSNRLGLAQWLTSPTHPLTARVAVNRYWQLLFGRGLVVTTEDFGSQGSPPTHPELLDWLAKRFIDSGWNVKQMLRTIVLSEVYRRDSTSVDGGEQKDAENVWLARGPSAPLSAEMIRDSALAASGLLSSKIGGRPAKPYEIAVSFKPEKHDEGEGLYRRSLYTYWKRTAPAPVMLVLDAPTRDVCSVRRERTSSPLQAMVLLNGPQYIEAAQGAAAQVLKDLGSDSPIEHRLENLFRRITGRAPNERELSVLFRLYDDRQQAFFDDKATAESYLEVGKFKQPTGIDPIDLATLSIVSQAIMNLDDNLVKR